MALSDEFPIWDKLSEEHRRRILDASEKRSVKRGTVLHDSGTDCMGLLLVERGQLRAYLLSEEGREVTICRVFPRDICLFSASCVMPNMQFDIFVEAEKDSDVWIIPACLYRELMEQSLPLAVYSYDLMANHLTEVRWRMEQILWKSFDKRLAAFLLEESRLEDNGSLKITHEKIANHLGTAREVVTRMLRYFQNEGMVRLTRGTVELTDLPRLERMGEEAHF